MVQKKGAHLFRSAHYEKFWNLLELRLTHYMYQI